MAKLLHLRPIAVPLATLGPLASRLTVAAVMCGLVCTWSASAQAARSPQAVFDRHVAGKAALGSGAWAVDIESGKVLISRSARVRRIPASVEKVLTSSTALDDLGPAFRFQTQAVTDSEPVEGALDGNLYLKGSGDPTFGNAGLSRLAQRIGGGDIENIRGRVLGDESLFDSRRGTAATGFVFSGYIGTLTALAFNAGSTSYRLNPPKYVAQRFRSALIRDGVSIRRAASTGEAPKQASVVASSASAPLSSIVYFMNQVSSNFYAEQLLKTLGARFAGGGTTAAGASVVRGFTRAHGVRSQVVDGSGLSRGNLIAPQTVGKLLVSIRKEAWFNTFNRSLPLAGRSGTLAGRMRGTAAQGRCRAKTGTLSNVSALAGYCNSRSGRKIAFAILMNGVNVSSARASQDRTVASLAAQ